MKTPKIADITTNIKQINYTTTKYTCKFCGAELSSWYGDLKTVRAHMLRKHRAEYYATVEYIIHEEADHLWTAAK